MSNVLVLAALAGATPAALAGRLNRKLMWSDTLAAAFAMVMVNRHTLVPT